MINRFLRVTETAKWFLEEVLRPGDIAIDMTAGNGHDTLLLAKLVGKTGKVFAVDIQPEALENTKKLLTENHLDATLILGDHAKIFSKLSAYTGRVKAITYNLGYLPNADHQIMTQPETTLSSLKNSLSLLESGGIITICTYAHEEGLKEREVLENFLLELSEPFEAFKIKRLNRKNPPELIVIARE